jgi:hypothetical protein
MTIMRLCVAAAALSAGILTGITASSAAFTCPGKADIEGRITKYITVEYWTPGHRETWKVKNVSDIKFGPIRTGQIGQKSIDYGPPKEICPVRVEYSFVVTKNDGRRETTQMGAGKTHSFYQDGYNEWQFKLD